MDSLARSRSWLSTVFSKSFADISLQSTMYVLTSFAYVIYRIRLCIPVP